MDDINKIKGRIAKLLAMADDTSSPEEAAIALGRARKLMDQHQISEAAARGLRRSLADAKFKDLCVGKQYKYMPVWMGILALAVARLNDCQQWVAGGRVMFRGFEDDVDAAVVMYEHTVAQVLRWCKTYMAVSGYGSPYVASVGNPYKWGMSRRVVATLKDMTEARARDNGEYQDPDALGIDGPKSAGTGLVVLKNQLVAERFGPQDTKTSGIRIRDLYGDAAYAQGWVDGANVSVHQQVSS